MIILNTGGTFNKIYDPIKGLLIVPKSNRAVEEIIKNINQNIAYKGLIYKDSLEFTDEDREKLVATIEKLDEKSIVVVHGTDTMDKSAAYVAQRVKDKCIIFTGSMIPYSIDKAEASSNLTLAIAKGLYAYEEGVFIAMHGIVAKHNRVYKDRQRGVFCLK
ncbi:asparaginase domain-containing protein [Nitratiruptor tergarcus]|uniref:L-asparaginase n=1 Tax=Nitratiruptor tergarcus DSM 16512 TaxID=1069081 RepID=A0A1W1WV86_9BACT|nr:asparaginase domain-containing protein [Nitratiruptor tergarcus]SMC10156.1 L-asparaginase [Nitratiruptor tergarcus DSM 16512]